MLLEALKSSLLLVDMQQRLLPVMNNPQALLARAGIVLKAATELGLPITISEQYPKGLGHTETALLGNAAVVLEKLSFSCWRDDALKTRLIELHESGRPLVIVAGIEAHVCVLQTCLDLIAAGFGVFAVTDAMSSRQPSSSQLAFERMRSAGVQMVNAEMVVFELLEQAGSPAFRQLSALIR